MQDDHISGVPTQWTEKTIRDLLRRRRYTYQRVDLPFGLATPGVDRSRTLDIIFPANLSGKTVLDLGSNHGFFCFEALRRGARRVVGYDKRPNTVRGAQLLAECLGVNAEFYVHDLDRQPIKDRFDYVLALNVLHHLRNPLGIFDMMIESARDVLALELAIPGFAEMRRHNMEPEQWYKMRSAPVLYLDDRGKYLMTPAMARDLLRRHQRVAKVSVRMSGFKDRSVVRAELNAAVPLSHDDLLGEGDTLISHPGDVKIGLDT